MAGSTPDKLANRILRGLVIGIILGVATLAAGPHVPVPEFIQGWLTHAGIKSSGTLLEMMRGVWTLRLDPFGRVFLRLLFFVVMPLVFASLATGVVQLGNPKKLGPLAGRTFFFFFLNMAIGVGLGLIMMNTLEPGHHIDAATKERLMAEYGGAASKHVAASQASTGLSLAVIVEMFMPANLLASVVGSSTARIGDVLPLILFAILVGLVGTSLTAEKRRQLQGFLELITEIMTGIVHLALRLAPYAVPCLIYSVLVKSGLDILVALGVFVLGCAGVMAIHLFGTMSVWLKIWTTWTPRAYFAAIKDMVVPALPTSPPVHAGPATVVVSGPHVLLHLMAWMGGRQGRGLWPWPRPSARRLGPMFVPLPRGLAGRFTDPAPALPPVVHAAFELAVSPGLCVEHDCHRRGFPPQRPRIYRHDRLG